jgi:hypothetical protein
VGVGSSGALMGMLSSWVVWIIFRWYVQVPAHSALYEVTLCIVLCNNPTMQRSCVWF